MPSSLPLDRQAMGEADGCRVCEQLRSRPKALESAAEARWQVPAAAVTPLRLAQGEESPVPQRQTEKLGSSPEERVQDASTRLQQAAMLVPPLWCPRRLASTRVLRPAEARSLR